MDFSIIGRLNDFTLDLYVELLRHLRQTYAIVPFCSIPRKNVPYLILRHDIDYSLSTSLRMAQIEQEMGIKGTYFALFATNSYDLLETDDSAILKKISDLGHEIGLHYYPLKYRSYRQNSTKTIRSEIQLLEKITGKKVVSISRHGPWDIDPFASIHGYINANHPYYRSDLFVHDSCRAWTPLEDLIKLLRTPQKKVQLLTHPDNWQDDKIDRATLLERLLSDMPKLDQTGKERARKAWFTDSLVREYDHLVNDEKLLNNNSAKYGIHQEPKNGFMKELDYYNRLIRWYLINTSTGWRFKQFTRKVRRH